MTESAPVTEAAAPGWQALLRLYEEPGVRDAVLELQDTQGADVLLVLLAVLLARTGVRLGDAELTRLQALSAFWQREVVAPLRGLRRRWRALAPPQRGASPAGEAPLGALRKQLAGLELAAEYQQWMQLITALDAAHGARLGAADTPPEAPDTIGVRTADAQRLADAEKPDASLLEHNLQRVLGERLGGAEALLRALGHRSAG